MAKLAWQWWTKIEVNWKTTQEWDFKPSEKFQIRRELLAAIEQQNSTALYEKLIQDYWYPSDKKGKCWISDIKCRHYVSTYKRPVIEKWYVEEQAFFHELINEIVKQNNEALCEALLRALEHISVSDINLRKLYHFDKVGIGAAIGSLEEYKIDATDGSLQTSKLKSEHLKNLYSQLSSILNSYDNEPTVNAKKSSLYPSLSEVSECGNLKMSPIVQQVKAVKCKLDMYACLHQYDAVLEKHREPKLLRVIGEILVALCTGFTFHMIHRPLTGRWSFFNTDTDSIIRVHEVDKALFIEEEKQKHLIRLTT